MTYVNGAAAVDPGLPAAAIAQTGDEQVSRPFTAERLAEIKAALEEPFDPSEIKWRVTATSTVQTRHGPQKRGQVIAYADQRAYTDRLNAIFGEWGWTRNYDVQVAQNFERKSQPDRSQPDKMQTTVAAKVVVVSHVSIHGLGTHTGVGEEWADNENAATSAEAQAFKRACACFGLGRYLYDLDKVWVDLDQYKRPVETPRLPDWALPGYARREAERMRQQQSTASKGNAARHGLVQQELLAQVRELCEQVGYGLSQFTLRKYAGVNDAARVGFAKLTIVLEKLSDIRNGIVRLNRAATTVGATRYATICREFGLASESLDDIPNREALRGLLVQAEQEASAQGAESGTGTQSGSISEARGRLLQAARKAAENARSGWPRKLGEVIAQASGGRIALETLNMLAEADTAMVDSVTATIEGGAR